MGSFSEVLQNNIVLVQLQICEVVIELEEMKALMGALVPNASSKSKPNTSLHLDYVTCTTRGLQQEWMEHLTTMLGSNTTLTCWDAFQLGMLMEDNQDSAKHVQFIIDKYIF